mgnify:CR=1 FL=1
MAKAMPDRFSGGLQLNITQIWDLPTARCRFGRFLRVAVGAQPPDIERLLSEFPPRRELTEHGELEHGLRIRLGLERHGDEAGARATLELGEGVRFFPSDAALASWMAQAEGGRAAVVYESVG